MQIMEWTVKYMNLNAIGYSTQPKVYISYGNINTSKGAGGVKPLLLIFAIS